MSCPSWPTYSVGSALGAALTDRRILGPAEAGLLFLMAAVAIAIGVLAALWPRVLAWPVAFVAMWSGIAWAAKGVSLRRGRRGGPRVEQLEAAMAGSPEPPPETPAAAGSQLEASTARDRVI